MGKFLLFITACILFAWPAMVHAQMQVGIGAAVNTSTLLQIAIAEAACPEDDQQCKSNFYNLAGEIPFSIKANFRPTYLLADASLGYDFRFGKGSYSRIKAGGEAGFYFSEIYSIGIGYGVFTGSYTPRDGTPAPIENGRVYWAALRINPIGFPGEISMLPTITTFAYQGIQSRFAIRDFSLLWRYMYYFGG